MTDKPTADELKRRYENIAKRPLPRSHSNESKLLATVLLQPGKVFPRRGVEHPWASATMTRSHEPRR